MMNDKVKEALTEAECALEDLLNPMSVSHDEAVATHTGPTP